ncbi:MAG: DUF4175 domain-containing protein, partial [Gemmataceae bacterium]|nr:DUF4175 domain-containing protein [Gemmataceae bacterium]
MVVTSGNPVVRRAAAVTLTAYLERTDPAAPLPDEAVLVYRIGAGEDHRLPMAGDGAAAFHLTLPAVADDLEYRVEVGSAVSPTYTVLVADPVELEDSTTTAITPPAYAAAVVPPRSSPGVGELHGLQHSTATLAFRFTRPAATAFLEWHPASAPPGPGTLLALTLTPDRRAATATVSLTESGLLRLVLATEDGPRRVRTEVPIPVRVAADEPPRFVQVAGVSGRPRLARPTDRVFVGFASTDDVGVGAAELEYAVGPEFRPVRLPLPLSGPGTRRVEGRTLFDLAGRAAEGQTIRLRLHVTDTRKLTDPALPPQTAVYPPSGWAEFKLAASAPPLDEQEYYGQRDELNEALTAAIADVGPAAAEVEALRGETATLNPLPLDHKIRIDRVRDRLVAARDRLRSAATEAELTPDLRPLAADVSVVSEGPLRSAVEHLGRARADSPTDRVAALSAAGKELIDARSRLADLLARNGRLAQARLDRSRLETLALDQTALADRLTPEAPAAELKTAQEELRSRLRLTIGRSEPLLRGFDGAAGRDRRALAAETTALMIRVRDLDAAARAETAAARKRLLARAGDAHAASAADADRVFARLQLPGRLAGLVLPRPEDVRKASDLIARDSPVEALVELEKLAADFDRTADAVEKWAADRADVKAAARQLAQWQDDLRSRFLDATRATPFARLPEPTRAALRTEQQTLRDALARLRFPADVTDEKAVAVLATTRATEGVDGDGRGAVVAMKTAADALARLAERTPSVQTRLAAARVELDRIRLDEEALYNAADQAARPLAERPLDPGVL